MFFAFVGMDIISMVVLAGVTVLSYLWGVGLPLSCVGGILMWISLHTFCRAVLALPWLGGPEQVGPLWDEGGCVVSAERLES